MYTIFLTFFIKEGPIAESERVTEIRICIGGCRQTPHGPLRELLPRIEPSPQYYDGFWTSKDL